MSVISDYPPRECEDYIKMIDCKNLLEVGLCHEI